MWKGWQYVYNHKLIGNQISWFIKIDDDTWFSAHNFRGFAQYFNPDIAYYMGHTLLHEWQRRNIIFNAGACYALSRATLLALKESEIFESEAFLRDDQRSRDIPEQRIEWRDYCVDRRYAQEDPTIGICLKSIGIWPMNSLDNQFRQRFHIFSPTDLGEKIEKEDTWFWRWKYEKIGVKENCCSPKSISFHSYKSSQTMVEKFKLLDEQFNNDRNFEIPKYEYHHRLQPIIERKNDSIFYFDEKTAPKHDRYFNNDHPPKGQRIFKNGQKRYCHQCEKFDYK